MNQIPKVKQSNKKFYNKWLYKSTFKLKGISILRTYGLEKALSVLDDPDRLKYSSVRDAANSREDFVNIINFLKNSKVPYAKRIESSLVDFYTNDKNFFEELNLLLEHRLISKYYPISNKIENDIGNNVFVKKYPHNKYQYKVYLRPHKLKGDIDSKKKFLSWLDTQDKVLISKKVKDWFIKTDWNWDRRYLLVEDENTLLFLKMRNADAVGKIYKYIIIDK